MRKLVVSHSSNMGDIVYSLPFVRALAKELNYKKVTFVITYNYPATYNKAFMYAAHPFGNVTMSLKGAEMVKPLLARQNYIEEVLLHDYTNGGAYTDPVNGVLNLELMRTYGLYLDRGDITKWYQNIYATKEDINNWQPWLENIQPSKNIVGKIVCCRSMRYWRPLNMKILAPYANKIVFLGVQEEWESFCSYVGEEVHHHKVNDFLEAAEIIRASKFCFGNQTGLFSIMEALKVPRVLESNPHLPNVITNGKSGYMAWDNLYFEKIMEKLAE